METNTPKQKHENEQMNLVRTKTDEGQVGRAGVENQVSNCIEKSRGMWQATEQNQATSYQIWCEQLLQNPQF